MNTTNLFSISNDKDFEEKALEIFRFQYKNNETYQRFSSLLHRNPKNVKCLEEIPFLPIEFFKSHQILSSKENISEIFTSSGTTGQQPSKHLVTDIEIYKKSFRTAFKHFYGEIENYCVLALLPSYLERKGSSLIYMAQDFIEKSRYPESGFYLNNLNELAETVKKLDAEGKKILLLGVSFALLDLIEKSQFNLKNTIVMETGGMKGKRKEMIREELHAHLKKGFGLDKIHSEYGMTELLSQAYSKGDGIFECPPQMKLLIRDPEDPLTILPKQKNGGINVIDFANINSCSFIATQDLGKQIAENKFEILGRFDHSDIRGCNLMAL
ncbi:LuxE/PaaK family acyltransferase [Mesonia maritima]|uniref:Phenylacetate-coenzyme A ligase PaaK-like adenylate-forming protein n=1 Tax=Mesonia maritima TaxID=1793873 RepID=A0ABU1K2B5_9FLAO|nr:acyl transferase [Mesonia maritima]MDR6299451.1 phenylacetate-coenzyme A ligase PaaK-like adenylate-forming protein [Mesonia maritima]